MDVGKALGWSALYFIALTLSACNDSPSSPPPPNNNKPYANQCEANAIPNRFIIRWKNGGFSTVRNSLDKSLAAANRHLVDYIEPDYRLHIQGMPTPEAALTAKSHGLIDGWGQSRINADKSWARAKGDGVIVAVVDAGVDVNHSQLRNQIAYNQGEIPGNSVDDDKNGYIDDHAGFDFYYGVGKVQDRPKSTHHGSHVSGIILAEHLSDGSGIKGIAPGARLLPLIFMDEEGNGSVSDAITAIHYAVSRGAKIINASWGADVCSKPLRETIASLEEKGILFVAAAGNGDEFGIGYNLDYHQTFPAAYPFAGQITVGAMDDGNILTGFSNFSTHLVHLLAPGAQIWSTVYDDGISLNHGYKAMDGTSMAAPFVSGAAAVLMSFRPKATIQQIKQAILASVTVPGQKYPVVTGGFLNLELALDKLAEQVAP